MATNNVTRNRRVVLEPASPNLAYHWDWLVRHSVGDLVLTDQGSLFTTIVITEQSAQSEPNGDDPF